RVGSGTARHDHRHAEQTRLDRKAQAWIEDVSEATSVTFEIPFLLARCADRAFGNPEADERCVAIAWVYDDDGPAAIDASQKPQPARSEVHFRPGHASGAENF